MKKIFVLLILSMVIITGVFGQAQFKWSGWGRGVFTPIAFDDKDSSVSAATATWQNVPRVGFSLAGTSESSRIGFIANFQWDGNAADIIGENAKVWAKPFPFLKLTVGKFNEDDLRGTIGTTIFTSWLIPSGGKDEDGIFDRFQASAGAHVAFVPANELFNGILNGLYVEAAVGSSPGNIRANRNLYELDALDVYKAVQIGIGYKIPQIGFFRAQFIGNNRSQLKPDDDLIQTETQLMEGLTSSSVLKRDADMIEAAFQLTLVENLNLDLGFKYPLPYTTDVAFTVYPALRPNPPLDNVNGTEVKVQRPIVAALGASYRWNGLSVLGRFDFASGETFEQEGSYKINTGASLGVWLIPAYQISGFLKVGIDIGFEMHMVDQQEKYGITADLAGSDYSDFGIGPWIELNLGGGTAKTGVMIMLPNSPRYAYNPGHTIAWKDTFSGKPVVSIPISLSYNF
jgi:hypothetical protein